MTAVLMVCLLRADDAMLCFGVFVSGSRPGEPDTKLCSEYIFDCSNIQVGIRSFVLFLADTLEQMFVGVLCCG